MHEPIKEVQDLINEHDVIVTYNGLSHDVPILNVSGYKNLYDNGKKHLDLMIYLKNTRDTDEIVVDGKRLVYLLPVRTFNHVKYPCYSLKCIAKVLGLKVQKEDLPYDVFNQNVEELARIEEKVRSYSMKDVEVTKELLEWLTNNVRGFSVDEKSLTIEKLKKDL